MSGSGLQAFAQQEFRTTSPSVIGYLEYLPAGYHSGNQKYPVVIFLHGVGEKGPASRDPEVLKRGVGELTKLGPPMWVKKGERFPFILISPQLKANYGTWPSSYVMEVVNHIKKKLRVDESRIYLTGLSLGGGGVWSAAQDNPDVFAAIAPVCGGYNSPQKASRMAASDLAVWAFHGDRDNIVPLGRSANMVNEINRHKPDPRAKMTVYPGVKHNAWDNAYRPGNSIHRPNVYEWMLAQRNSGKKGGSDKHDDDDEDDDDDDKEENGKGKGEEAKPVPPVVTAGADRRLTLPQNSVSLKGQAETTGSRIKKWQWQKISGNNVTLRNASAPDLLVSGLSAGSYVFQVTVTDEKGLKSSDQVSVIVEAKKAVAKPVIKKPVVKQPVTRGPSGNGRLVAFAGSDKTVKLPSREVRLEGTVRSDGSRIVAWRWTQNAGSRVSIKGANTPNPVISGVKSKGRRSFRLMVIDDRGRAGVDHVRINFVR